MYNYYELGYVHALEKLGMVEKDAGIRSAFGAVKSVFGGKGMPLVNPEVQALKGQAELAKLRAGITERSAQGPLSPRQMTKNESKYNKIHQRYGIENTPTGAPAAAPAAQAPIAGATAPVGNKSTAPVTQSPTTPPVKTDAAAAGKGKDPAKDPGFLSKYKWPIGLGAAGLAGVGGYAYLKNRDPMGGTGQLPSGYGGGY
jgi:hypothetical protein